MTTLNAVYCKFGEVSEAAQLLETELGNILLEIEGVEAGLFSNERPQEAAEILKRINSSTLGRLLKDLDKKTGKLNHGGDALAKALTERNRLAHSFFRLHNFRRNSKEGCALMMADLEEIHRSLLAAYKLVLAVSGIDLDALAPMAMPRKHRKLS